MHKQFIGSRLLGLALLTLFASVLYEFIFINPDIFQFALSLRTPKLIAILLSSILIGTASFIFQTVVNNQIITPSLLGMNSLYLLLHTGLVFLLGANSFMILNQNLAFLVDLLVMGVLGVVLYSYLLKVTSYNILYVLLIGAVMSGLFEAVQNSLVRIMDPNSYDKLLSSLIASFSHVNAELLLAAFLIIIVTAVVFKPYFKVLDILLLGRSHSINLGVDYDKSVKYLLVVVIIFIATATALVGPVSFVGLITTNLARQWIASYKHQYLIFSCICLTAIILLLGQIILEHLFIYSVPISVFINIGGGIYFLYLLLKNQRKECVK